MFLGAAAFNQPIGDWNTSSVRDMCWMFLGAAAFNQLIPESWDMTAALLSSSSSESLSTPASESLSSSSSESQQSSPELEVSLSSQQMDPALEWDDSELTAPQPCPVCFHNRIRVVFVPRGHTSCRGCGRRVARRRRTCHVCRAKIESLQEIFM